VRFNGLCHLWNAQAFSAQETSVEEVPSDFDALFRVPDPDTSPPPAYPANCAQPVPFDQSKSISSLARTPNS
jgi:hypothetical protein